jgi:hypothetical protein
MAGCAIPSHTIAIEVARIGNLTVRLSDAGLHQRQTKALYPDHRLPPWLTEDATRDRSNRLLDDCATFQLNVPVNNCPKSAPCIFITSPIQEVRFSRGGNLRGRKPGRDKIQPPAQILNGTPSAPNVAKNLVLWHSATLVHISVTIKFLVDLNLSGRN